MHNLFLVYFVNLYMFRPYLGPSSGGTTVCMQQLVIIILLGDSLLSWLDWIPIQQQQRVPTVVYIRLYLLMMGLDTPETCRG